VPEAAKQERLRQLQSLIDTHRRAFDLSAVGRRLSVLFEAKGRKPGQVAGRSPYLQPVYIEGPETLIGRIAPVDILAASPNSLTGVIKSGFEWLEPVQAAE
jgi:tRNA-2-methylthio-N6-dimethylallyladenosine synthase